MPADLAATILVVDDNPAGRYATARILRAAGFAVLEAATGREALDLARGADLVVLDVNLPDISGFEVCRRIRSTREIARLPVIHLSATFVKDVDKVEGLEAGADGYLTHPVEPPVLVATANAFLRTRRAEDEMRKSEAKFKAIFDQALSGILLVSKDLVYLEANPAMCAILGRAREAIVGRHHSSFVPAGLEHDAVAITREVEERGAWRGTFPVIRPDGSHVELEWSIARHSIPGVRLAIVNDITDRKALESERERLLASERAAREEAERANRLKDEFLATLSHELRTPLNAIVGWAQIIKGAGATAADVAEGIDTIERNAMAQAQLIADLLDVSRITSGKIRLELRVIDLAATVREATESVIPAIQSKGIRLERSFDPDASTVRGDPDRLQQVVWNLMNNAVKFTPKGGTIGVRVERHESDVRVTVADNGRGIKADFLPHIFERFRQEDATTKRNQGGLGLGLAIVKHLVEMHGGTIAAHSDGENRGARFVFNLPFAAVGSPEPATAAPPESAAVGRTAGEPLLVLERGSAAGDLRLDGTRVLIVEDDDDARGLLTRVLSKVGAEVRGVHDVAAALEAVPEFRPHVLVSDVGMPGRDGYDLIRALRDRGHTEQTLPAIALTAFARNEDRSQSFAAGFQQHLSKPVQAAAIIGSIASLARGAR